MAARLKERYEKEIKSRLRQQFGYEAPQRFPLAFLEPLEIPQDRSIDVHGRPGHDV